MNKSHSSRNSKSNNRQHKKSSSSRRPHQRQAGPKNQNKNNNRRRRHYSHRQNRSRRYPLTHEDKVVQNYLRLLNEHLDAREKYYEFFDRNDGKQRTKYEREFSLSIKRLRDYEDNLSASDKDIFEKFKRQGQLDLTYSSNHELDTSGKITVAEAHIEDPHTLESQKQSDFSQDTDESEGTLEDYYNYKGLPIPNQEEEASTNSNDSST